MSLIYFAETRLVLFNINPAIFVLLTFFYQYLRLNIIFPQACPKILLLSVCSLVPEVCGVYSIVAVCSLEQKYHVIECGHVFISTIVKSFIFCLFLLRGAANIKLHA